MRSISNINSQLSRVQKIERQLFAQLAAATALEGEKRKREKKRDDARRKILLGAIVLKLWEDNSAAEFKLDHVLDMNLITKSDRALFDLPEKQSRTPIKEFPDDLCKDNLASKIRAEKLAPGTAPSGKRFAVSRSLISPNVGIQISEELASTA